MSLQPGEVFAGYTIVRELGAGGMGAVYLANHPRLPRNDALKLLRPELCSDQSFVVRFEREADMVAQLDHPNIVAVHDRGSQDGQLWISMRFIDGINAEAALREYPAGMPPARAVRIIGKVASALDYAHKHRLLHRDVKPANILLTPGPDDDEETERVFLSDFGVAKAIGEAADSVSSLTSTGSVVATLDYASPEQIKGQPLDHRSDIYALGCVLYKLLTGGVPYPADSVVARVYGHLNKEIPRPSDSVPGLPPALDEVVAKAMAKEPDDRYPTCRALALAARAALSSPATETTVRPAEDGSLPTTVVPPDQVSRPIDPMPEWLGHSGAQEMSPSPVVGSAPSEPNGPGPGEWPGPGQHGTYGARAGDGGTKAEYLAGVSGQHGPPSNPGPVHQPPPDRPPGTGPSAGQGPGPGTGQGGPPPDNRGGPTPPSGAAPTSAPPSAGRPPRRMAILAAVIGGIVLIGAVTAALLLRTGVAGTASPGAQTNRVSTSGPASSPAASSAETAASSSAAGSTKPGPVPGLPHSDPLPEEVLIAPRVVDGTPNLFLMDASSGAVGEQVTDGPGIKNVVLSPDRGSMIYLQAADGAPDELRTASVAGTDDRPLFETMPDGCDSFERPGWNPADPTEIALPCTSTDGTVTLHRLTIDGTDMGVIPTELPAIDDVTYAPDGARVAYWGREESGRARIYIQPADGSEPPTPVTDPPDGAGDVDPVFSPDGSTITFSRSQKDSDGKSTSQLFSVGVDGSELTQLTDEPSGGNQGPIYSPDGQSIAFKSSRPNAAGTSNSQIWVIDADGGNPRELGIGDPGFVQAGSPAWGHR